MIQELLTGVMEDRKTPTIPTSSPSQSATSSPSSASVEPQQNLRCPRCDSSNTKFCYYNNYNLTQPRHFCKTCRRYWTKGGALRNVPIGGGCRKTKSSSPNITIAGKTTAAGLSKAKPMTSSSFDVVGRAPPELLWAGVPHSSHLMALLRASQMQNSNPSPNPNPNPSFILNPVRAKEEGGLIGGGAMMTEPQLPMFRNESPAYQYQQQQNMMLSEAPTSSGIQELYQRLRSSSMNNDHLQVMSNNVSSPGVNANCFPSAVAAPVTAVSVMSTASSIMEPIPLTGGDFGYWNPMMTWPDISTANGAFP